MFNYGYIVNPITNRKVSVYTTTGKKIINNFIRSNYATQFAGSSQSNFETFKKASQRSQAPNPSRSQILRKKAREREYLPPNPSRSDEVPAIPNNPLCWKCGKNLEAFYTTHNGYFCDSCMKKVNKGTIMHGCHSEINPDCDFDLCDECAYSNIDSILPNQITRSDAIPFIIEEDKATKPIEDIPISIKPPQKRGCVKITQANSTPSEFNKYNTRPSPPFPANQCPTGMKKKGRDGIMWEVSKPDKRGTKKWVKVKN